MDSIGRIPQRIGEEDFVITILGAAVSVITII